jgi:hypothetical protein
MQKPATGEEKAREFGASRNVLDGWVKPLPGTAKNGLNILWIE